MRTVARESTARPSDSVLLAASIVVLPIGPDAVRSVSSVDHPSLQILRLLAATIGIPYFLLSSTSPLLQAWYARRLGKAPYRLYALSNLASMGALLTYPALIEPTILTRSTSLPNGFPNCWHM